MSSSEFDSPRAHPQQDRTTTAPREPNPVLVKELRGRMRGKRAFVIVSVYLALLSCFASVVYYANYLNSRGPGGITRIAPLGKPVFYAVVGIELFMVTFLTPALVTGAITGEKERQTYDLLRVTLLPARALVSGKLVASLSYMVLLILVAVPVQTLAFVLGGVSLTEVGLALLVLMAAAVAFATLGIFFSSLARSTLASTVLTYVTILVVTIVLPLATGALAVVVGEPLVTGYGSYTPPVSVQAALIYVGIFIASLSPFTAAVGTELMLMQEDSALYYWQSLSPTGDVAGRIPVPSPWLVFVGAYLLVSAALLVAAMARVSRQTNE